MAEDGPTRSSSGRSASGWQPAASWDSTTRRYSATRGPLATIICGVTYIDTGTASRRPFLLLRAESDVTFLRSLAYSMSV